MARMRVGGVGLLFLVLLAAPAWAQQLTSTIAGVVKDAAGVPVASTKVEASSPALIEKVRTAFSDSQGQYKIVDLPIGIYEVTFSAPGFSTVRNAGVDLPAAYVATVNASLKAGSPGETITVTGASASVDSQSSVVQSSVTTETSQALPSGQQAIANTASVTGGMVAGGNPDVGGLSGLLNTGGNGASFHGKAGIKRVFDGLRIDNSTGAFAYVISPFTVQTVVTEAGGGNAESLAAGFTLNSVPKSGSNTFKFTADALYTNSNLQQSNLTPELQAAGLVGLNRIQNLYDYAATFGGRIKKDKLWFFLQDRNSGTKQFRTNTFHDATINNPIIYTPDPNLPGFRYDLQRDHVARITWQATPRNKVNAHISIQDHCFCGNDSFIAVESDTYRYFTPNDNFQISWSSPVTSKLLLEAAVGFVPSHWPNSLPSGAVLTNSSITELSTGFVYKMPATFKPKQDANRYNQRLSASYTTGSHAFKFGVQNDQSVNNILQTTPGAATLGVPQAAHQYWVGNASSVDLQAVAGPPANGIGNVSYNFLNGKPNQVVEWATPFEADERTSLDLGIYGQDQWTMKKVTLNYGVRFDHYHSYDPAISLRATQFVGQRDFPLVDNVPLWNDLSPRFGIAWDVFGDGKTAVKFAYGKFVNLQGVTIATAVSPVLTSVNSVTRNWTDTSTLPLGSPGNLAPNCDLTNPLLNGDCGPISDFAFGSPKVVTKYDPQVTSGWGNRDYIWDMSAEFQRQVTKNVAVTAGYYKNWGVNFNATDNQLVSPSDYSPFCVTVPNDPRLPGAGAPLCGFYDVAPKLFGQTQNLVSHSDNFGKQISRNDFVGFSVLSRLSNGARFGGSVDGGRTVTDKCFVVDSPQQQIYDSAGAPANYCNIPVPFMANLQVKANGSYPIIYGVTLSGTFQNLAGPQIRATYPAPNADIAVSLGRNLASCGAKAVCTNTYGVPLIKPGTQYEPRRNQLDLRLTKAVKVGKARLQGKLDLYNVMNSNSLVNINVAYGSKWLQPTTIMDGRVVEFSASVSY